MHVAIVGGNGNMGQLVSHFLQKHHHRVHIVGRSTRNIKKVLESSDVVILSTPLNAFDEILKKLQVINLKKKLIIDLSSYIGTNLQRLQSISSKVAFMHLLFGPDIYHLKGQHIVTSPIKKSGTTFKEIVDVFIKEGAQIIESSAEHHDKMMAYTQALSQFNSIALAKTLSELGVSKKELENFATLTFSLNKEVISRIVGQDAQLWASIQFRNSHFPAILRQHRDSFDSLTTLVKNHDYKKFNTLFGEVAAFWHDEKKDSFVFQKQDNITAHKKGRIGLLGPQGSFSQQAAIEYNKTRQPVFFETISDIVNAVANNEIQEAILPFENSIEGTVRETLDGLYRKGVNITDEIILPIQHCIAGIDRKVAPRDIEYIYSHPQALAQCRAYIQKHYPRAKLVLTPSTSAAFQKIKNEGLVNARAIGPHLAATIYKLSIIDENIQDQQNNQTLFVAVARNPKKQSGLTSTILVIDPATDKPGLLYTILGVFAKKSVNLSKIESRPSQSKLGKYIFFLRADIKQNNATFKNILKELKGLGSTAIITH
jgi:prephenate dehydratase